jgi:hypothetical protein
MQLVELNQLIEQGLVSDTPEPDGHSFEAQSSVDTPSSAGLIQKDQASSYENLFMPSFPENLKTSIETNLACLFDRIEAIDMLISEYSMELNRGQRLFQPRLCVVFLKDYAVRVDGKIAHDRKPVFVWQKQNSKTGKWFIRKLKDPKRFSGEDYFRKMASGRKNAGENVSYLMSVIVQIKKLMKKREELEKTIGAIKTLAKSNLNKDGDMLFDSRSRLYELRGKIETNLPEKAIISARNKGIL